ncbi:MAG TPA: GNAT family N-acetyltransferase [Flavisolibacter sp.]|nr:GNAT family N-acetyltransferase [Flavisolibacter sp.]
MDQEKTEYREATPGDIPQIQFVRHTVKENILSNPLLVTDNDCKEYITQRGKGWVCEVNQQIIAFAIADLVENNIWALFVHPDHAGKGIGKQLHTIMLDWYFSNTNKKVWLSTAPGTKAETFYRMNGWTDVGYTKNGEVKFEMTGENWKANSPRKHYF